MTKLIKVQKGQDGAVLVVGLDDALEDAKPVPVMDVAEVVAARAVYRARGDITPTRS